MWIASRIELSKFLFRAVARGRSVRKPLAVGRPWKKPHTTGCTFIAATLTAAVSAPAPGTTSMQRLHALQSMLIGQQVRQSGVLFPSLELRWRALDFVIGNTPGP